MQDDVVIFNKDNQYEKIKYVFPKLNGVIPKGIMYTKNSLTYITKVIDTFDLKKIIQKFIDTSDLNIMDATSNIGGDTLSFSTYFKDVHSFEINPIYFNILENNISIYKKDNIFTYNESCVNVLDNDFLHDHSIDVVYIDPPWGGNNYKLFDNIRLYLSPTISLEYFIVSLFSKNIKMVIIKIPLNYDTIFLKNICEHEHIIVNFHILYKMIIGILTI